MIFLITFFFVCSWPDFHPAASLTVSPDRVQHFIQDSVTLKCDGNSTSWRVMKFSEYGFVSQCSYWGAVTGSTCNTHTSQYINGVYWCESETGQFSNAVNITGQCEFKSHFFFFLRLNHFNTTLVLEFKVERDHSFALTYHYDVNIDIALVMIERYKKYRRRINVRSGSAQKLCSTLIIVHQFAQPAADL